MTVLQSPPPHQGFVVEASSIPSAFIHRLEATGLAAMTARTVDGLYLEPAFSLSRVVAAFRVAGIEVDGVRRAGSTASWHVAARAAAGSRNRLANPLSPEWLPTLPAA